MSRATIVWVDEATSTNSLLAQQCDELLHGTVIAARRQTAGRGQRGNSWESQPDSNLTFSLLLRPQTILAARQFELSMIVSLGVCDALSEASGLAFKVKWPNDIYVGDKKICGILIENSLEGNRIGRSIAGIGININQERFLSDAPNPISLKNLTGHTFDLEQLLCNVCETILSRMAEYEENLDARTLTSEYRIRLWRGNGFYQWLDAKSGMEFEARIGSVASDGILTLVDRQDCERTFAFKEVSAIL